MRKIDRTLKVHEMEIRLTNVGNEDYICLTDMVRAKDGDFFITDWLRNRNTLEFLGIWESLNNPDFNYGEFAIIKNNSGLNSFKISVKEWTHKTHAKGLFSKAGRYGGTFAHKDIAFEFGTWVSAEFKLYLIKDYQRLKNWEDSQGKKEWDLRRFLSKVNYQIQTDAIRDYLEPTSNLPADKRGILYADEADLLNLAIFGMTAREWRQENPELASKGLNIRDLADMIQLNVLANLESYNAILIGENLPKKDRFMKLFQMAQMQFTSFMNNRRIAGLNQEELNLRPPENGLPPKS